MTLAWYGHLKFKAVPLVIVILASWGIAFVEYCFAVPANRLGSAVYSPAELKTMQEVITLIVFAFFTWIYFDEPLSLTQGAGFALIALGADARVSGPALIFFGYSAVVGERGKIAGMGLRRRRENRPEAASGSDTSEEIADCQHDIGDDGDPERVFADEGNCHEFADDGQRRQNQRDHGDRRRRGC